MGREIGVGLHFYQPPRWAIHPSLSAVTTDPEGKDWTRIIKDECYKPLAKLGILEKATFDIYQSLLLQLNKLDPQLAAYYHHAMKENGIGDSFIHPILPDLSNEDKDVVIQAGVQRFMDITNEHPRYFWPPETAVDTATLERLSYAGYEGFICAPEQIILYNGARADNTPTLIKLPSGRDIIALPFDRSISGPLGNDPKINADDFTRDYFVPSAKKLDKTQLLLAWTDAETFGHHWKHTEWFLKYLLDSSLPSAGLYPVSLKSIPIIKKRLPPGRLVERSAWSCACGNLVRWHGSCSCHSRHEDTSWKHPFYKAVGVLDHSVTQVLEKAVGKRYSEVVSGRLYAVNTDPHSVITTDDALVAAKVSSLTARTSCATFFADPEVSGKISLLYAYQALVYLNESGDEKAALEISGQFFNHLSRIRYPNSTRTALTTLDQMLRQG